MKDSTREDYERRILDVLVYIQEHLDGELLLDELARVAHFSPFHFHRIVRGMVGESVQEHVRRLRLERAAHRLRTTHRQIVQIAFEAGYESHEAFTRAFRALSGESPSRFRARRSSPTPLPAPSGVRYDPDGGPNAGDVRWAVGGAQGVDVEAKAMPPMRFAFVRHVGPYVRCEEAWDRLLTLLGAQGFLGAESVFFGLSHDDPDVTPPEKLRYDACVSVGADFEPRPAAGIGVQETGGGDHAVATHSGPYDRLGETYDGIFGVWLPRSGREPRAAPSIEIYWNDPHASDPEDLLTEVCVPLEPLRGRFR